MPTREIHNQLTYLPLLDPKAAVTDNTAQVSNIIDTANYNALEFVLSTGTLTDADATFAVTVDHGDQANLSDAASVPAAQLVGTLALASFDFSSDSKTRKIGYIGAKRYVRLTVTPANNTGNLFLSGVAVLGNAASNPQANPPV